MSHLFTRFVQQKPYGTKGSPEMNTVAVREITRLGLLRDTTFPLIAKGLQRFKFWG